MHPKEEKLDSELRVESTLVRGGQLRNLVDFYFNQQIVYDQSINEG